MSTDDITDDLFSTALEEAAERGVDVRVLFDHLGTLRIKGYRKLRRAGSRPARSSGAACCRCCPCTASGAGPDLRNHRKILVVDGEVAFTGRRT